MATASTFMKVTVENLETGDKFVVKVNSLPFSVGSDSKNTIVLRDDPDILPHHFHIVGSAREEYFETDKGGWVSFDRMGKERFKGKTRNYPTHVRVGKYWLDWAIQGQGEHGCCACTVV